MNLGVRIVHKLKDSCLKQEFFKMLSGNFSKLIEERLSSKVLSDAELKELLLEDLRESGKFLAWFKNTS